MRNLFRLLAAASAVLLVSSAAWAAEGSRHRVAIQVDQDEPAVINLALNNATNVIEHYKAKGEEVEVEVVRSVRASTCCVKTNRP